MSSLAFALGVCLALFSTPTSLSHSVPIVGSSSAQPQYVSPDRAHYDIVDFDTNFLKHGKTGFSGLVVYLGFQNPLYINAEPLSSWQQAGNSTAMASALSRMISLQCGPNVYSHPQHEKERSSFRVVSSTGGAVASRANESSVGSETPYSVWIVQFLKTEKLHAMSRHVSFSKCNVRFRGYKKLRFTNAIGGEVGLEWNPAKPGLSRKNLYGLPEALFVAQGAKGISSTGQDSMFHYKKKNLDLIVKHWIQSMSDSDVMKVLSLYRGIANAKVNWGNVSGNVHNKSQTAKDLSQHNRRRELLKISEEDKGEGPAKVSKAEANLLGMLQLEHKLRAAENAGVGVSMKTIREELENPMKNALQYDVPEVMHKLIFHPSTEAMSAMSQATLMPAVTDPVLDQLDTNWRNGVGSNMPGSTVHHPAGSLDHHKVGLADDVAWGISEAVAEELLGSVVEKMERSLIDDIPNVVTRNVVREMYPTLTRALTEDLSQGVTHEVEEPLSREVVQDIAQALIPALTLSLAPIVTHSLTRRPSHDYYCYYCHEKQMYCAYCEKANADAAHTDYYAAYYASYFSRYYAYYYGRMDVNHFDDPYTTPSQKPIIQVDPEAAEKREKEAPNEPSHWGGAGAEQNKKKGEEEAEKNKEEQNRKKEQKEKREAEDAKKREASQKQREEMRAKTEERDKKAAEETKKEEKKKDERKKAERNKKAEEKKKEERRKEEKKKEEKKKEEQKKEEYIKSCYGNPTCSGHGKCGGQKPGKCQCNPSWSGEECTVERHIRSCRSVGDPHPTSFMGHRFNIYEQGEFMLAVHPDLSEKHHAYMDWIAPNRKGHISANVGYAVQAGGETIVVSNINGAVVAKIGCKTVNGNTPGGNTVSGSGSSKVTVKTAEGSVATINRAWSHFVDTYLTMKIPKDGKGRGICGAMGKSAQQDSAYLGTTCSRNTPCNGGKLRASSSLFGGCSYQNIRARYGFKALSGVLKSAKSTEMPTMSRAFAEDKCKDITSKVAKANCIEDLQVAGSDPALAKDLVAAAILSVKVSEEVESREKTMQQELAAAEKTAVQESGAWEKQMKHEQAVAKLAAEKHSGENAGGRGAKLEAESSPTSVPGSLDTSRDSTSDSGSSTVGRAAKSNSGSADASAPGSPGVNRGTTSDSGPSAVGRAAKSNSGSADASASGSPGVNRDSTPDSGPSTLGLASESGPSIVGRTAKSKSGSSYASAQGSPGINHDTKFKPAASSDSKSESAVNHDDHEDRPRDEEAHATKYAEAMARHIGRGGVRV
jgi:hypothetical protein